MWVKDYCRRELITCNINDTVIVAAEIMRAKGVSSLIACDDIKQPIGILTDRDLRNKVIAGGLTPLQVKVSEVMTTPVISVTEDENKASMYQSKANNQLAKASNIDSQGQPQQPWYYRHQQRSG